MQTFVDKRTNEIFTEDGSVYSQTELDEMFSKVQEPSDWRARICTSVARSDLAIARAAVMHFTGTELEIIAVDPSKPGPNGRIMVAADGYRDGPCGP